MKTVVEKLEESMEIAFYWTVQRRMFPLCQNYVYNKYFKDIFFSDPADAHEFPMEYLERVKKVHSQGGYGSQG